MCNFFSFISNGRGKVSFADAKLRTDPEFIKNFEPDSHTSLAAHFYKSAAADDQVNKFEFLNGEFVVDQINVADDTEQVKKWCLNFVGGDAFKEICLAAVKQNGLALQFVKEQTEELCLAAVKQNGLALQFVKEQTEELCLAEVKQNGLALQFVKEQTEEICLAAVKQNGWALGFVKDQTKIAKSLK
jgi:hypothetical protein